MKLHGCVAVSGDPSHVGNLRRVVSLSRMESLYCHQVRPLLLAASLDTPRLLQMYAAASLLHSNGVRAYKFATCAKMHCSTGAWSLLLVRQVCV